MKISVDDVIDHEPEDFSRHQGFSLIAESDNERELLRRMVTLREHTSLRALTFQFETKPRKPMERQYIKADFRLCQDSVFQSRTVDNQTVKKGA